MLATILVIAGLCSSSSRNLGTSGRDFGPFELGFGLSEAAYVVFILGDDWPPVSNLIVSVFFKKFFISHTLGKMKTLQAVML